MDHSEEFNHEDFLFFKKKIFDLAGIHLTDKKMDLVRSRVQSFLRKSSVNSVSEFRKLIQTSDRQSEVVQSFINLLTTNKTDFFREPTHFDYLTEQILPKFVDREKINVWCCAASTGEEPYTIAMTLDQHLNGHAEYKILASDIDTNVLKKARNGVYPVSKANEIPEEFHRDYLVFGSDKTNGYFKIADKLHSRIQFKQHNLIENSYPGEEVFDLIFCRNVLIYFEPKTIGRLMEKLYRSLKPDGFLFIGHSESIQGSQHLFKAIRPAIFRPCPSVS